MQKVNVLFFLSEKKINYRENFLRFLSLNEEKEINLNKDLFLNKKKINKINKITNKYLNNKDITFLLKKKRIYNVNLDLKRGVFVPQFDSEILIDEVLKYKDKFKRGIEVGVGTGAITISIIKNSNIIMSGIDINKKAIKLSKKNLIKNNISLNNIFFKKNVKNFFPDNVYDFLVFNPPYVDKKEEISFVSKWVKNNQPSKALYAKNNGLFFYEFIIENKNRFIKEDGYLFFEIGFLLKNKLEKLILKRKDIDFFYFQKDFSNKNRCLVIKFKK